MGTVKWAMRALQKLLFEKDETAKGLLLTKLRREANSA
jgi:hypothetical protein